MNHILIIDDDDATLKLASLYLSRAGYRVEECLDSMQALASIGANRPELVLCDIHLPGLDGYGLLSALRAQPNTEALPVILMTAHADHPGFRKGMKLGADDYLTKPLDREELLDAVAARLLRARTHSTGAAPAPAEAAPDPGDLSGVTRLTDYKLVRKIAEGGMSSIYLADQKSTGRRVVLKLFPLKKGMPQEAIDRFVQEHKMLERLHHPNIVEIYAQGFNDEHLYIAMEYFQNGSLNEHLQGALPEAKAFEYAIQIAKGLEAAHRAGIVHRDLKPENIMVRKDGTLALTDFGIAKDLNAGSSMTVHGEVMGTPSYVAPEQAQGLPVGPAADVYSLGVMLFQMLTGKKPYQANDPANILYQHINSPIPRLPEDLAQWQDLINFLMTKSPQTRPRDASAVLAVFRAFGLE
jgi:CheY-like chemotaxis protein/tRNA A-37 threonylcarbamoyl transferase component Bud32